MAEEWRPGEEWAKRMRDRDEWRGSRGIRMSRDVGRKGLGGEGYAERPGGDEPG